MNFRKNTLILKLEGRLKKEEEADLIAIAMEEINNKEQNLENLKICQI